MGPVGVVTEGGQWMVDLLDYRVLKYPTSLVSVLLVSVVSTFCSIFVIFLFLFLVIWGGGNFSVCT